VTTPSSVPSHRSSEPRALTLTIECALEAETGRWIGEVVELPGVLVYGATEVDALSKVEALALRVVGEKLEHGEIARPTSVLFQHR
jgi:predicted RNase H-like HicB family nuclease